jgi:alpha-L-fucosidase
MIKSLAKTSKPATNAIASVSMVGSKEKIRWKQTSEGLIITKPEKMPSWQVIGFKIEFRK